jgi:hypothetical protein
MLAARMLLAIFVMWGTIVEMTRPSTFTNNFMLVDPILNPGCRYTVGRLTTTIRGWPMVCYLNPGLPEKWLPFEADMYPTALLCDGIVIVVLVAAAWNVFGVCRFQFGLADVFMAAAAMAAMSFIHMIAWDRQFNFSQFAIDLGVFSATIIILHMARELVAGLLRRRARGVGGR